VTTIRPFLWFNDQAEDALDLYTTVFGDSVVIEVSRYPEGSPGPAGQVMTATLRIANQEIMLLNGGPLFEFTPAISLFVSVASQDQVDHLWEGLIADGGRPGQCGWLEDRFGVSWQIVPTALGELLGDRDPQKAGQVMQAMLSMSKIEISELRAARDA